MRPSVLLLAAQAECPELEGLLTALGEKSLAPEELVLRSAWQRRQEAVAECRQHRARYLELEALLSEINVLVGDFLASSPPSDRAEPQRGPASPGKQLQCDRSVYQALHESLTTANAAQRLRIPAPGGDSLAAAEGDGEFGLHHTIFGLSPVDLLAQARAAAASATVHSIPELEQRLARRCRRISQLVQGPAGGAEEPAKALAARTAALRTLRWQDNEAQLRCAALCRSCLEARDTLAEALRELLVAHKLGSNREMLEAQAKYLEAQCRALLAKLEALRGQVMSKTYSADNVRALHVVAGHIQGRELEVKRRLDKAQKKLSEYNENEAELRVLAEEAAVLKEKTADTNYALEQLQAVERFTAAQQ